MRRTDEIRKSAEFAANNTDSFEIRALAIAMLKLCDLLDADLVLPPEDELKERVGVS